MTTPDAPADPPSTSADGEAPETPRATRPTPAREAPRRSFSPYPEPEPAPPEPTPSAGGPSTSEAIAAAVRLGYDVIGQNIEQGRQAAHRFRAGAYSASEAPQDLARLAARMLNLTRELSTTTFDVLERLIQDPNFAASVRPSAPDQPPPAFYPGSPPKPPEQVAPAPQPAPAAPPTMLELTCVFTGDRAAVMRAGSLCRPQTPAFLVLSALAAVDPALPPITDINFGPAEAGDGVIAQIGLKPDQPPGLYSGVICAYDTQLALGLLTIEVLP